MKEVLAAAGVPTARYGAFTDEAARPRLPRDHGGFYVVKTDGLAAGKGVLVTESLPEAREAVRAYLSGEAFGDAGRTVVIEEGLTGPGAVAARPLRRAGRRGRAAGPRSGLQAHRSTATPAPTRAAWAPTRRCPSSAPEVVDEVMAKAVLPTLHDLESRGVPTGASSTPGSCSPPRARRSWSTTSASATPSARWWSPGWPATSGPTCASRPPGRLRDAGRVAGRGVRHGRAGVGGLSGRAAHRRRHPRPRGGGRGGGRAPSSTRGPGAVTAGRCHQRAGGS